MPSCVSQKRTGNDKLQKGQNPKAFGRSSGGITARIQQVILCFFVFFLVAAFASFAQHVEFCMRAACEVRTKISGVSFPFWRSCLFRFCDVYVSRMFWHVVFLQMILIA
jgi:hypothetical protein